MLYPHAGFKKKSGYFCGYRWQKLKLPDSESWCV